jgi:hypothetical protein
VEVFCWKPFLHVWQYLALQLGPLNIQVNAIAAGVYETETTVDLFCKEWMDRVGENRVPLKKWGHRDPNLTCVVLFLSTEVSLIPSKDSSITTVGKVTSTKIWYSRLATSFWMDSRSFVPCKLHQTSQVQIWGRMYTFICRKTCLSTFQCCQLQSMNLVCYLFSMLPVGIKTMSQES